MSARALDIAASLGLALLWAAVCAGAAARAAGTDLGALYLAARFAAAGNWAEIYSHDPAEFFSAGSAAWTALAAEAGVAGGETLYPYVYPPIWAALLGPAAEALPWPAFKTAGAFLGLAALGAAPMAVRRLARGRASRIAWTAGGLALLTVTQPFLVAMVEAQPQMLVSALVLLALALEREGRGRAAPHLAGAALGLAAALKLTPAVVALWWAATGRWRPVPAFLLVGGGLGVAQLAALDLSLTAEFLRRLSQISALVIETPVNHALDHALLILSRGGAGGAETTTAAPLWLALAPKVALALGAVGIWAMWRAAAPGGRRDAAGALAVWTLATLAGPIAWSHHFLGLALWLMALPLLLGPGTGLLAAGGVWALLALPVWAATAGFGAPSSAWALPGFFAALLGLAVLMLALRRERTVGFEREGRA